MTNLNWTARREGGKNVYTATHGTATYEITFNWNENEGYSLRKNNGYPLVEFGSVKWCKREAERDAA